MKILRITSIAVLLSLALAASAAASSVKVTVSSASPLLGTAVTYHVSGEAEEGQMYEVRMMSVSATHPESECEDGRESSRVIIEREVQGSTSFELPEASLPAEYYNALGAYAVCAIVKQGRIATGERTSSTVSFTVVSPPAPPPVNSAPPISSPASSAVISQPVVSIAQHPIVPAVTHKPVQCKKTKKHSKCKEVKAKKHPRKRK